MSKIIIEKCHLSYAAIHKNNSAYVKAVLIHYISPIVKPIIPVIILVSNDEIAPVIIEAIKILN